MLGEKPAVLGVRRGVRLDLADRHIGLAPTALGLADTDTEQRIGQEQVDVGRRDLAPPGVARVVVAILERARTEPVEPREDDDPAEKDDDPGRECLGSEAPGQDGGDGDGGRTDDRRIHASPRQREERLPDEPQSDQERQADMTPGLALEAR